MRDKHHIIDTSPSKGSFISIRSPGLELWKQVFWLVGCLVRWLVPWWDVWFHGSPTDLKVVWFGEPDYVDVCCHGGKQTKADSGSQPGLNSYRLTLDNHQGGNAKARSKLHESGFLIDRGFPEDWIRLRIRIE